MTESDLFYDKCYTDFNKSVRQLFNIFKELPSQKFKSTMHIKTMQSKLNELMRLNPNYLIITLGPKLITIADKIESRDYKYFIDKNYEPGVRQMSIDYKVNYTDTLNTVNYAKDAFTNASDIKRGDIRDTILKMIQVYADFALKCKEENKVM